MNVRVNSCKLLKLLITISMAISVNTLFVFTVQQWMILFLQNICKNFKYMYLLVFSKNTLTVFETVYRWKFTWPYMKSDFFLYQHELFNPNNIILEHNDHTNCVYIKLQCQHVYICIYIQNSWLVTSVSAGV